MGKVTRRLHVTKYLTTNRGHISILKDRRYDKGFVVRLSVKRDPDSHTTINHGLRAYVWELWV